MNHDRPSVPLTGRTVIRPVAPPSWTYIIPTSPRAKQFQQTLMEGRYLVLEHCTAIEGYRLCAFPDLEAVKHHLRQRTDEGYANTIAAVTKVEKTITWPLVGTPVNLEELL